MKKKERIIATLKGIETDRIPFSVYQHSTVHERDINRFVDYTLGFYEKYDPDYIKVMFDDNYDTPVNWQYITDITIWKKLENFDPHIGAFGRQLEILKQLKDKAGENVPVIQTIFSPFHFSHRLTNRRMLKDWEIDPESVEYGFNIIAENLIAFSDCCLKEAGIDGFFFGAFGCEESWMTESQYKQMVMPFDLKVLNEFSNAEIVILHIHGEKNSFFNLLKEYPCNGISWEDRISGPSLKEAIKQTDKCLIGGINHLKAVQYQQEDILNEAKEAIYCTKGRKFILAPGCTFLEGTPENNMHALKIAVEKYGCNK